MNKKYFYTTFLLIIIFSSFILLRLQSKDDESVITPTSTPSATTLEDQKDKVTLLIDFGDGYVLTEDVAYQESTTAFDLLVQVLDSNELTYEVTEYDFGVFVESIDDKVGSADMAWIYFINGESGMVAADQAILEVGDLVEYKFIEPEY